MLLTAAAAILLLFLVASVAGLAAVFVSALSLGDRLLAGGFLGALAVGAAVATFCAVQPLRPDDISKVSLAIHQALNDQSI
jgi:hypothetical protein